MDTSEDLLIAAASQGRREEVARLLEQGVPVDGKGTGRRTALDLMVWAGGHDDVVQQLLEAGADTEQRIGEYRETLPLLFAATRGQPRLVRMLLEAGADPEGRCGDTEATPLMMAVAEGHTSIVEMLVDSGADMNQSHGVHWDAVHAAAAGGRTGIIRLLRSKGAVYTPEHLVAAAKGKAKHEKLSRDPYYQEHFPPSRLPEYTQAIALIQSFLSRETCNPDAR